MAAMLEKETCGILSSVQRAQPLQWVSHSPSDSQCRCKRQVDDQSGSASPRSAQCIAPTRKHQSQVQLIKGQRAPCSTRSPKQTLATARLKLNILLSPPPHTCSVLPRPISSQMSPPHVSPRGDTSKEVLTHRSVRFTYSTTPPHPTSCTQSGCRNTTPAIQHGRIAVK